MFDNVPIHLCFLELVFFPEAATAGVLWKKMFLKNLQYSQEITCIGVSFLRSFLIKHLFSRTSTLYLPVVSPNAGKYGPEKIPVVEAITWLLTMLEFRLYSQLLKLSIFFFRSKLLIHFIKSKESWTII